MIILNQPTGLGDILFTIPLARYFIGQGEVVVYPYDPVYGNIGWHFPDIGFIPKNSLNLDFDEENEYMLGSCHVFPLRFADENLQNNPNTMRAKYDMFGLDFNMWRKLTWKRGEAEKWLYERLNPNNEEYIIVNKNWHHTNRKCDFKVFSKYKTINMEFVGGYTMLDWGYLLENAKEIHTVGTSIVYMLEILNVKNVHLYKRPNENSFDNYDYLLEKKYTYHR